MMTMAPTSSVLLVTCLPDERAIYGDALRAAGFAVQICAEPLHAFSEATLSAPDAVITHLVQPGFLIDGIELTRRLREHDRTRNTGVIVLTARIEPQYRAAALAMSCDAYLLLPCLPDDLIAEVKRVMAKRSIPPAGSAPPQRSGA